MERFLTAKAIVEKLRAADTRLAVAFGGAVATATGRRTGESSAAPYRRQHSRRHDAAGARRQALLLPAASRAKPVSRPPRHSGADVLVQIVYAVRTLCRRPGFTAVAIVTLALGIGATPIFSVVNAVLLRPLPFPDADRLVLIYATDEARGNRYDVTSYPAFADWRDQNRSFDAMTAFAGRSMTVAVGGQTVFAPVQRVSPSF